MRHFLIVLSIVMLGSAHAGDARESPPERMLGYVSAGVALGWMVLGRTNADRTEKTVWRIVSVGLAILILTLLSAIPFLGWLIWLAALLMGIGGLLLQIGASARAGTGPLF